MSQQPGTCPACGANLIAEARFCVKCGQPIVQTNQTTPIPQGIQIPPISVVPIMPMQTPPPMEPTPLQNPPVPPVIPQLQGVPPSLPPPVVDPLSQISSAPQTMESVLCVIGKVSQKTGLFSSVVYHMVVTGTRLIFALQTKEMLAADAANARSQAKQQGKNIFGQVGAQIATRSGDKYLGIAPELIFVENPQNFMIPLDSLKIIETYSGDFEENAPDTMVVKTMSDKLTFTISHANSVLRELKPVLGHKVK